MPDPKKPSEDDETDAEEDHGAGLVKAFQEIESDLLKDGEEQPDTGIIRGEISFSLEASPVSPPLKTKNSGYPIHSKPSAFRLSTNRK